MVWGTGQHAVSRLFCCRAMSAMGQRVAAIARDINVSYPFRGHERLLICIWAYVGACGEGLMRGSPCTRADAAEAGCGAGTGCERDSWRADDDEAEEDDGPIAGECFGAHAGAGASTSAALLEVPAAGWTCGRYAYHQKQLKKRPILTARFA